MNDNNLAIKETANASTFREFLLGLSQDTLYMFNHFGTDINSSNVDSMVQKELSRKDRIKFFSFAGNKMISYSFLALFDKPTKKHNCILGIVIGDGWQGKGHGKAICKHMVARAWESGLEKIWLNVYSDNPAAIHLYRSAGFEVEGVFMADEIDEKTDRHVISMATFKGRRFGKKERLRIWDSVEGGTI